MSRNPFSFLFLLFLHVSIDLYGRQLQLDIDATKLTILQHLKIGPALVTEGVVHTNVEHKVSLLTLP